MIVCGCRVSDRRAIRSNKGRETQESTVSGPVKPTKHFHGDPDIVI